MAAVHLHTELRFALFARVSYVTATAAAAAAEFYVQIVAVALLVLVPQRLRKVTLFATTLHPPSYFIYASLSRSICL